LTLNLNTASIKSQMYRLDVKTLSIPRPFRSSTHV
jgi:hypothetical protein